MSKKTELVDEIVALELLGKPAVSETERDALVKKYRKKTLPELQAIYDEQSKVLADATADLVEEEPTLGPLPTTEELAADLAAIEMLEHGPLSYDVSEELPVPKDESPTAAPSAAPPTPAPTSGVCTVVISGAVFSVPAF